MVLRRALFLGLCLAAMLTVAGLAVFVRIVVDGLGRNRTMLAYLSVRTAWKQGHSAEAMGGLIKVGWMVVEGGARWQVAEYYLQQSADLKQRHHLTEAAQACLRAGDVLGPYDNISARDRRCDLMSWEYEQSP